MRTTSILLLSACSSFVAVRAQTSITCDLSGTQVCQGTTVVLDYTATGTFDGSNFFFALLSDENGSFAAPENIGEIPSTTSGQISCSIPVNAVPGSGYRMRVDATAPSTTGGPNSVDITIVAAPFAGWNNSVSACSNGAPFILSTEGDPGGSWYDPAFVPCDAVLFPNVDPAGCYTYVVAGMAPCPADSATICVNLPLAPDAGTNTVITVCSNGDTISLIDHLGGTPDPGGVWTDPGVGPHPGYFVPGEDAPGCYTYTVVGQPPCANDVATLCITVVPAPFAGGSNSMTVCGSAPPFVMIDQLVGNPQAGGTWSYMGAPHSPVYVPAVDPPGCYYYTVQGSAPCVSDTAELCISEVPPPNAGTDNNVTVCSNEAPFIMLVYLGGSPQPGGTWTDPTGAVHSGIFHPVVDPAGCYVYAVEGTPPCADAAAVLCISISPAPDAGISVTDTVCLDGPPFLIIEQLDGTPQLGGTWSFDSAPHSGVFIPGTDPAGCYRYLLQGMAPCADDSSTWCVVVDPCLNLGASEVVTTTRGLHQVDGWNTDHPTFAFANMVGAEIRDALGRRVECPMSLSRQNDRVLFSLDLSGLATGSYWVVAYDATHGEALRVLKW